MTEEKHRKYYLSGRRERRNPFGSLGDLSWNAFEDFSAFKTYFRLGMGAVLLIGLFLFFQGEFSRGAAFLTCSGICLLPLGVWASGKVDGFPIYPVYALTYFATFSLQIFLQDNLTDTRGFFPATDANPWTSTLAVGLLILPGTWIWYLIGKRSMTPPASCQVIARPIANQLMLAMFIASSLTLAALATEQFGFVGRFVSIINAAARTGSVISLFILSYQYGSGGLNRVLAAVVGAFLFLGIIASMASLFMGGAISLIAVAIAGYSLGKRRFPWVLLLLLFPILSVLHAGKGDMRVKYWGEARAVNTVTFTEYPAFFMEWFDFGLADFEKDEATRAAKRANQQSLLERSSLIQIFLTVHHLAPDSVDYLSGETYKHIPMMLIPRFLYPDKPVAHEGQRLLNTHFLLQNEEQVIQTYIAWGLMNEAYANFGFWGLPPMGVIIALFFSWVARSCASVPLLSFRGLVGALTLGFAIQAEMAAAVWVTSYAQSIFLLLALRLVLMKNESNPKALLTEPQPTAQNRLRRYLGSRRPSRT